MSCTIWPLSVTSSSLQHYPLPRLALICSSGPQSPSLPRYLHAVCSLCPECTFSTGHMADIFSSLGSRVWSPIQSHYLWPYTPPFCSIILYLSVMVIVFTALIITCNSFICRFRYLFPLSVSLSSPSPV